MAGTVWFASLGQDKSIWQGHWENKHEPFVHLSHLSATFLTELMGLGLLTRLLHFKASFTVWPEDSVISVSCFPLGVRMTITSSVQKTYNQACPVVKRVLYTQPYLNLGDLKHCRNTNSVAFSKTWVGGRSQNEVRQSQRVGFIIHNGWEPEWKSINM